METYLPLKAPVFLILLSLAERETHGYALVQEVRTRSGGRVELETGPLYRHLRRLSDDGLIEDADPPEKAGLDQRRKYYRLTPAGRRVLVAETRRLADLVEAGRRLHLLDEPAGA
jgi:DNA-binding PadR family transcriptional regulator